MIIVGGYSTLRVEGGLFTGNFVQGQGGALWVDDGGHMQVGEGSADIIVFCFVNYSRALVCGVSISIRSRRKTLYLA